MCNLRNLLLYIHAYAEKDYFYLMQLIHIYSLTSLEINLYLGIINHGHLYRSRNSRRTSDNVRPKCHNVQLKFLSPDTNMHTCVVSSAKLHLHFLTYFARNLHVRLFQINWATELFLENVWKILDFWIWIFRLVPLITPVIVVSWLVFI